MNLLIFIFGFIIFIVYVYFLLTIISRQHKIQRNEHQNAYDELDMDGIEIHFEVLLQVLFVLGKNKHHQFNTVYKIAGNICVILSLILILTKTAVIIIKVNKKEATVSNVELTIPTSKPIPPKNCKHPNKIR